MYWKQLLLVKWTGIEFFQLRPVFWNSFILMELNVFIHILTRIKKRIFFVYQLQMYANCPHSCPPFFFLVTWLSVSSFWNMLFSHWTWLLFSCSESLLQAIWKYSLQTEILKDFILQMHCQKDECGNCDGSARLWYLLLV